MTLSSGPIKVVPRPQAARDSLRRVFVRDLILACSIGVHAHEHDKPQRVRLNLDLDVIEPAAPLNDDLRNVVDYDAIIGAVRHLIAAGHVRLIETLAERVAALCLADRRIVRVRVQIEKLDVYRDVGSVGVAIERVNPAHPVGADSHAS